MFNKHKSKFIVLTKNYFYWSSFCHSIVYRKNAFLKIADDVNGPCYCKFVIHKYKQGGHIGLHAIL